MTGSRAATESDIIYLNLAGTLVIVVNSAQAAHDLFEKRSSLYSDRYVCRLARIKHCRCLMTDVLTRVAGRACPCSMNCELHVCSHGRLANGLLRAGSAATGTSSSWATARAGGNGAEYSISTSTRMQPRATDRGNSRLRASSSAACSTRPTSTWSICGSECARPRAS